MIKSAEVNSLVGFQSRVLTFSSAVRIASGLACSMPISSLAVASSFGTNACLASGNLFAKNFLILSPAQSGSVRIIMPRFLYAFSISSKVFGFRLKPPVMIRPYQWLQYPFCLQLLKLLLSFYSSPFTASYTSA